MDILRQPILLASKSPRRKQLLTEAGFNIRIATKEVDESYPEDMPATEVAQYLAEKKAMACADFLRDGELLLAADSIVVLGNEIFEKPEDRDDAFRIIRSLSGNKHQVITGVCLLGKGGKVAFSEVANVYMDTLSDEEIAYYIDNYQPYDKAGAYAIQEWIGLCKINKIEGTFQNVMGLPVAAVYRAIREMLQS